MLHDSLFIFDIETVPDVAAAKALLACDTDDVQELRKALSEYHLGLTDGRNDFPRQPFHQIVAISFLEAEIERDGQHERYVLKELRSGGEATFDEETLVKGVFQYLQKLKPRLVSYNGRNFDLPVMKFRAMKYGVSAPWLYRSGDKWNSYQSRYSSDWHCDLLDVFKDYGAMQGGLKINEIATVLGLPGKVGVDGSMVAGMYDNGQIEAIRNYCETDVLNTYLLYLHWQYYSGTLKGPGFVQAVQDVLAYIQAEEKERPYLGEFFSAWQESSGGTFGLPE
jgi:predicted PolB exonuclease-like 3'-5' exonuclease